MIQWLRNNPLLSIGALLFLLPYAWIEVRHAQEERLGAVPTTREMRGSSETISSPKAMYLGQTYQIRLYHDDKFHMHPPPTTSEYDCEFHAPEFEVARTWYVSSVFSVDCVYQVAPKRTGSLMLVWRISRKKSRGNFEQDVATIVPVREPPSASIGTVSTALGIIVALSGLFKTFDANGPDNNATTRLLKRIRRRNRPS